MFKYCIKERTDRNYIAENFLNLLRQKNNKQADGCH